LSLPKQACRNEPAELYKTTLDSAYAMGFS